MGHDGPPTFFWSDNLVTGEPLARCPVRQLQLAPSALSREVTRWKDEYFPHFRAGHLVVSGAISDQPARWLQAMRYLDHLRERQDTRYMELTRPSESGGQA